MSAFRKLLFPTETIQDEIARPSPIYIMKMANTSVFVAYAFIKAYWITSS